MSRNLLYIVIVICIACIHSQNSKFKIVYEWGKMDFDYNGHKANQDHIIGDEYIPKEVSPMDVDVYYSRNNERKVFITIPRLFSEIVASLGTVEPPKPNETALIKPYPSWQWHQNAESCKRDRLLSVFRIKIDRCGRLWVIDAGRILYQQQCPPQILAFDLNTDQLIHRYEIPADQRQSVTHFVTIMPDVRDTCENTFVYLADCRTYTVLVYDTQRKVSWLAQDKTMFPNPNYGTYTIQGEQFQLMDGILALSLSPYSPGQDRKLFYHAMSSVTENWVYTSDLRNQSIFSQSLMTTPRLFHTYNGTRTSQSATDAIDKDGILFFGLMTETTINCWNTATEYGSSNFDIVEYNPTALQFVTGFKILDNDQRQQELWILSTRYQKIWTGTMNSSEINFRVQTVTVEEALRGTKCKNAAARSARKTGVRGSRYVGSKRRGRRTN